MCSKPFQFISAIFIIQITFLNLHKVSAKCDWFQDVFVMTRMANNTDLSFDLNKTISGQCLEPQTFDNIPITYIFIKEQEVPSFGERTVENLEQLESFSVWGCKNPLSDLEPGSFRNVPKLKRITIANCQLKEIQYGVFNEMSNVEVLRVNNNGIDVIEDKSFANLYSLREVHVDSNALEHWNREWFTNSTKIEVLDFQWNKIRTIPRRAFASMKKLRQAFFDDNEISRIHADAFKGITNLEYLGLRNNNLKVINENVFPNTIRIRRLLVNANYLNFIPNELLRRLYVQEIRIDNNPWKCPCLDRILFWMFQTNGTVSYTPSCNGPNVPVCAFPTSFSKTCLEYVDDKLTHTFIDSLRKLSPPLDEYCARLSGQGIN